MKKISNPNKYIKAQVKKIVKRLGAIDMQHREFDDVALLDDSIFEWWDNAATTLYHEVRGGAFEAAPNDLYPADERAFNDAANDITDRIEALRKSTYEVAS